MTKNDGGSKISSFFRDALATKYQEDPIFLAKSVSLQFAETISKQLDRKGMSKADLASRIGTSRPYVTELLKGKSNITIETMFKICLSMEIMPSVDFVPIVPQLFEPAKSASNQVKTETPPKKFSIEEPSEYEKAD